VRRVGRALTRHAAGRHVCCTPTTAPWEDIITRYHLLSESNYKADKSADLVGWLTGTLQLAPGRLSGYEVCFDRGHCYPTCVFYAGRGGFDSTKQARIRRTKLLHENPDAFYHLLSEDLAKLSRAAEKLGLEPCCRPNCFSDVPWEERMPQLFTEWPGIQFYDYTKSAERTDLFAGNSDWPANYHLTYSWSEKSKPRVVAKWMDRGVSVAIPMRENRQLPPALEGRPIVDGDQHDAIFLHPPGSVLVLKPKGLARTARTEFIP